MATVPEKRDERVSFYESKVAPWTSNATTIGLVAGDVTLLNTKVTAAQTAIAAQVDAEQAAKAATAATRQAMRDLSIYGADLIKTIRAKAEQTKNPAIYILAQIPEPAQPSPKSAPGTPRDLLVTINGDGTLEMKWKCSNASNCLYQIFRSVGGSVDFDYLGGVGQKKFSDTEVPVGATQLTYKIQAVRSSGVSQWATFNVYFGSNAGGPPGVTVNVAPTAPARIAA